MRENKSTHTPTHTAVWELQNAEMFDFPKGAIFSVLDIKYCHSCLIRSFATAETGASEQPKKFGQVRYDDRATR
jgi:hypothetical protein